MNELKDSLPETLAEKDLYPIVFDYLVDKYELNYGGTADDRPISLPLFNTKIFPDIFGLANSKSGNIVVMAEGKRTLNGREFDICKGQGITLQRFANYVYLFFPRDSWLQLTNEERQECVKQCADLSLGLLVVNMANSICKEICSPKMNNSLLKESNKQYAIKAMVDLFPDFSADEHSYYFRHSRLGNTILVEGLILMNKLCDSKVNLSDRDGIFALEGPYKKLNTGESCTLNYMPFGVGVTFDDDEIKKKMSLMVLAKNPH